MPLEVETLYLDEALSLNEREALSRFLAQIIVDVHKISALFAARGADASIIQSAESQLETVLAELRDQQESHEHAESVA